MDGHEMRRKDTVDLREAYSIAEAAAQLGIGRRLAYRLARDGALPTIRLGARILVPRAQLDRLLDGREI